MTFDLFETEIRNQRDIPIDDGELTLWTNFFSSDLANTYFDELKQSLSWTQPSIKIAGKQIPIPRLQAWHGESGQSYTYSQTKFYSSPWNQMLSEIKQTVETVTEKNFNAVLCNLYRDGKDSVGWHADNEQELGVEPIVASISFGATRKFYLKHQRNAEEFIKLQLPHNSLLLMGKGIQNNWLHQVPKEPKVNEERLNLTFRFIYAER